MLDMNQRTWIFLYGFVTYFLRLILIRKMLQCPPLHFNNFLHIFWVFYLWVINFNNSGSLSMV